jgi:hypothetical protein
LSDYFPSLDELRLELPLFSKANAAQDARRFHESEAQQREVLEHLRCGESIAKHLWEDGGKRLAPAIEQLRNAHGFTIAGTGTAKNPYRMKDLRQCPTKAHATDEMQAAYYGLLHWQQVRSDRLSMDSFRCVCCHACDELQCHHLTYKRLFAERLTDLMTLCRGCHELVHESCRLKFPSGVPVSYAAQLGWKGFAAWLLP